MDHPFVTIFEKNEKKKDKKRKQTKYHNIGVNEKFEKFSYLE